MLITIIVVTVLLVLVIGLLIFWMQRRSQRVVPDAADRVDARQDRVVSVNEEGQAVRDSQEGPEEARDDAAFEAILKDEIEELEGR